MDREMFHKAIVIAGKKGLNRLVKWVHVMEVTQIGNLLNGNELILSTGMAWKNDEASFLSLVQELIDHHVSGLCIELGTHLEEVPANIMELADKHGFPIIVFQEEVRFIDITQDLHTFLIQQHFQMISELEAFSQELNRLLLGSDPQILILNHLHETVKSQVLFKCSQQKELCVPALQEKEKDDLFHRIKTNKEKAHLIRQPIQALDHQLAELILFSEDRRFTELDVLLADRSSTALANQMLREMYTAEKKRAEENSWIQEWLEGRHREDEIENHLFMLGMRGKHQGAAVFCVELQHWQAGLSENQYPYIQIIVRSAFEPLGFYILPYAKREQLIFIMINLKEKTSMKDRLLQGIGQAGQNQKLPAVHMAAGKLISQLSSLSKSYDTAQKALRLQTKLAEGKISPLYDDLHMYRLISMIRDRDELHDFVNDYLQPVIDHDAKYQTRLLKTLKIYLMCKGSKQETAGHLFIVRQTLYHRIKQLEDLLGDDFMQPGKRQALEFAAMAHEYLELE
ncbi:PucR family transcriptional regulator [Fictibacillus fluitans]|uniref:PucR family transcriptional regulator ligand-binding domain-containing protein n=1 Tax=Fictibacillus fluitans TaxID=3058422 RepID=A0ABT8HQW4_9BACL|nr:PucR family transcriptional regulator ligand-binding domain-containing protein [Fictibacillus sp. NE201]MDN4522905.1 PucR family transcriptional regulator ligand-binding domain-containing protein [Fictibacillus sp. NE201]